MSEPKEIFVRMERCMGCHSCEIACATAHSESKQLYTALAEHPAPRRRLYVEWVPPDRPLPILCRHCEDAPCMHACIAGAITREAAGVVKTDADRCIGCWTCVMVCPYGVIGRHMETKKAYRCDRCADRPSPACVDACPTRALVYERAAEYSGAVRRKASRELISGERG